MPRRTVDCSCCASRSRSSRCSGGAADRERAADSSAARCRGRAGRREAHGDQHRQQSDHSRAPARGIHVRTRGSPSTTRAGRPTGRRSTVRSRKGQPSTFGLDDVIDGWTEGVQMMVEGEKRRFWIPGGSPTTALPGAAGHAGVRHRVDPDRFVTSSTSRRSAVATGAVTATRARFPSTMRTRPRAQLSSLRGRRDNTSSTAPTSLRRRDSRIASAVLRRLHRRVEVHVRADRQELAQTSRDARAPGCPGTRAASSQPSCSYSFVRSARAARIPSSRILRSPACPSSPPPRPTPPAPARARLRCSSGRLAIACFDSSACCFCSSVLALQRLFRRALELRRLRLVRFAKIVVLRLERRRRRVGLQPRHAGGGQLGADRRRQQLERRGRQAGIVEPVADDRDRRLLGGLHRDPELREDIGAADRHGERTHEHADSHRPNQHPTQPRPPRTTTSAGNADRGHERRRSTPAAGAT